MGMRHGTESVDDESKTYHHGGKGGVGKSKVERVPSRSNAASLLQIIRVGNTLRRPESGWLGS
jgi:hypothetical protein